MKCDLTAAPKPEMLVESFLSSEPHLDFLNTHGGAVSEIVIMSNNICTTKLENDSYGKLANAWTNTAVRKRELTTTEDEQKAKMELIQIPFGAEMSVINVIMCSVHETRCFILQQDLKSRETNIEQKQLLFKMCPWSDLLS